MIAVTHFCIYSSTATYTDDALRTRIITDMIHSICNLGYLGKVYRWWSFCKADGFDECSELTI